jgi:hypothetical protein
MKSILGTIVSFICENHLTYAANCGETYLPVVRKNKEVGVRMVTLNWNDDIESLAKNVVTNIWLSDGSEEKKSIYRKFLVDLRKLKWICK